MIRTVQRVTVPDLAPFGLPRPKDGVYTRIVRDNQIPILDVGFIDAVRQGRVEVVAAVTGFDGSDVLLCRRLAYRRPTRSSWVSATDLGSSR